MMIKRTVVVQITQLYGFQILRLRLFNRYIDWFIIEKSELMDIESN